MFALSCQGFRVFRSGFWVLRLGQRYGLPFQSDSETVNPKQTALTAPIHALSDTSLLVEVPQLYPFAAFLVPSPNENLTVGKLVPSIFQALLGNLVMASHLCFVTFAFVTRFIASNCLPSRNLAAQSLRCLKCHHSLVFLVCGMPGFCLKNPIEC